MVLKPTTRHRFIKFVSERIFRLRISKSGSSDKKALPYYAHTQSEFHTGTQTIENWFKLW